MEGDALVLISARLSSLDANKRSHLWRRVVELCEALEAVNGVAWRDSDHSSSPAVAVLKAHVPPDELQPLAGYVESISVAGPEVMELNLYTDNLWVAGISDWGDDLGLLVSTSSLRRFTALLEEAHVSFDLEEIEDRPTWNSR